MYVCNCFCHLLQYELIGHYWHNSLDVTLYLSCKTSLKFSNVFRARMASYRELKSVSNKKRGKEGLSILFQHEGRRAVTTHCLNLWCLFGAKKALQEDSLKINSCFVLSFRNYFWTQRIKTYCVKPSATAGLVVYASIVFGCLLLRLDFTMFWEESVVLLLHSGQLGLEKRLFSICVCSSSLSWFCLDVEYGCWERKMGKSRSHEVTWYC